MTETGDAKLSEIELDMATNKTVVKGTGRILLSLVLGRFLQKNKTYLALKFRKKIIDHG